MLGSVVVVAGCWLVVLETVAAFCARQTLENDTTSMQERIFLNASSF
jgi:hypothetical protein